MDLVTTGCPERCFWLPLQGTTPQGLPEKQPEGEQKDQKQNGAGPSWQNGQGEWVARGGSAKGSRHHGVDPVIPFTEASQLKACPILAYPPYSQKPLSVYTDRTSTFVHLHAPVDCTSI